MMTKQLAAAAGLPDQAAAIVLHTLRQLQLVDREMDRETRLHMWEWRGGKPRLRSKPSAPSSNEAYTVEQAASLTGLTPKAIRRRIERGKLEYFTEDRRRMIPHDGLVRANLLGDRADKTKTERGIRRAIFVLSRSREGKGFTTWELRREAMLGRQVLETVLASLQALELVSGSYHMGYRQFEWRWTGAQP
jgi:hypothetical protein